MATHRLDASPRDGPLGLLRRQAAAAAHRRLRRHRHHLDGVGHARLAAEAGLRADRAAGVAGDPRQGAGQARRPAHPHRAGGGARRQGRPGARGPHQGDRAQPGLGLQHHPPARRRAAGRLQAIPADPHPARQAADDRQVAVGPRTRPQAVLRHHGGGAAGRLGHDQLAAAAARTAATSTTRSWSPAPRSICRSTPTARCSPAATATACRATARSASPRSRPG